jgi:hypothetical protein
MFHSVVETPTFLKAAKEAGLSEDERNNIVTTIAIDPEAGEIMKETGGARKLRVEGKGKGKSGGFRVITYFGGDDIPVFLLDLFSKGQKVNLTQAERNTLRAILSKIATAYRNGVVKKLVDMHRK